MKSYYVTTPIYYVNDIPHIGHTYTTVAADILARYHQALGEQTFFLTGTDEHAKSSEEAARKGGEDVATYVKRMSDRWEQTWKDLNLTPNYFIRTTQENHKIGVEKFFQLVYEKGDIYKGHYEGLYCQGCEEFKTERDLTEDGLCPHHKKPPEKLSEENYFFALSKYRQALLDHYTKHLEFIQPESRRQETINYVRDHLTDISISRPNLAWGIPFPIDQEHRIYVWFDALINYLTGVGYGWDEEEFHKYWPANCHLVGKDIIKFHCALWPAMLLSAGIELPKQVFAHGFFTINGEKISKSLGNTINPIDLKEEYGFDAIRYYLFSEIPFGSDGNFSEIQLKERYNSQLANGLGNLVSRIATLCQRCQIEYHDKGLSLLKDAPDEYHQAIENLEFHTALDLIWKRIGKLDKLISEEKIWELPDEQLKERLQPLIDEINLIAILILPFLPETSEKLLTHFKGPAIKSIPPLFPRKK